MGFRSWLRPRVLEWAMRQMNELRPPTVGRAEGRVLEIGFGTGINLEYYGPGVKSLVAVDPDASNDFEPVNRRVGRVAFPVEREPLRADRPLPFESGSFDCAVSTWTLCSIPEPEQAFAELRRVLRPGGRLLFVEHGRAEHPRTAAWQDRLDPLWTRIADGCHMNRPIDALVTESGFRMRSLERFRHDGPSLLAQMYRGEAERLD